MAPGSPSTMKCARAGRRRCPTGSRRATRPPPRRFCGGVRSRARLTRASRASRATASSLPSARCTVAAGADQAAEREAHLEGDGGAAAPAGGAARQAIGKPRPVPPRQPAARRRPRCRRRRRARPAAARGAAALEQRDQAAQPGDRVQRVGRLAEGYVEQAGEEHGERGDGGRRTTSAQAQRGARRRQPRRPAGRRRPASCGTMARAADGARAGRRPVLAAGAVVAPTNPIATERSWASRSTSSTRPSPRPRDRRRPRRARAQHDGPCTCSAPRSPHRGFATTHTVRRHARRTTSRPARRPGRVRPPCFAGRRRRRLRSV